MIMAVIQTSQMGQGESPVLASVGAIFASRQHRHLWQRILKEREIL